MTRIAALVIAVMLLPAAGPAAAQPAAADEALLGLWAYRAEFGPALRGALTIRRTRAGWRAMIAGRAVPVSAAGSALRATFGTRAGFRGRLGAGGRAIAGFWLQSAWESDDRPFATPILLRRARANEWRGAATPLDGRFTLYLSVFRDGDGALMGAFRNPERNSNGGANRFRVSREGDAVRFNLRYDGGEINHDAAFLRGPDRIRLRWDELGREIELTRIDPARAASFFPRPPGAPPYAYRAPPRTGDGWRTASAGALGIDEAALAAIVRDIAASDPTARPPTLMHSMLVAYRGRLVLEEYFYGYDRDTPHDTRSAAKTFSSVMLGAAMMRGAAISPESRVTRLLARMGPFANPDPRKDRITLAQLMTHSAGLACNDNDDASPGNEETMSRDGQPQPNRSICRWPTIRAPATPIARPTSTWSAAR